MFFKCDNWLFSFHCPIFIKQTSLTVGGGLGHLPLSSGGLQGSYGGASSYETGSYGGGSFSSGGGGYGGLSGGLGGHSGGFGSSSGGYGGYGGGYAAEGSQKGGDYHEGVSIIGAGGSSQKGTVLDLTGHGGGGYQGKIFGGSFISAHHGKSGGYASIGGGSDYGSSGGFGGLAQQEVLKSGDVIQGFGGGFGGGHGFGGGLGGGISGGLGGYKVEEH